MKPGRKRAYSPQLYHGIKDKPMDDRSWEAVQKSNKWLSEALLQEHRIRQKLRLIVSKHVERLREAA
jgi:hypothetical protein